MLAPTIPIDEDQRLADLRRLDLLLTTPEETFDRITRELARIFDVHAAMMSFTDSDTQYFKSAVGLTPEIEATRTEPRELSVCSHVIAENRMLVVEDLLDDDRFRDNPLVVDSGARFYAGTPLQSDAGHAVGTLCIVDVRPRTMGDRERELLHVIADGVMAQVKLQAASRQLLQRTKQMERDLEQAVLMQRYLLPPTQVEGDGWRIASLYRPFEHLGGDFLGVHRRPDGKCAILVADVSGHGTPAALTTAMTKTAFHRTAPSADTPTQILTSIHRDIVGLAPPYQFMTAVAALFDPAGRTVTMASAGHPYPLLVRGSEVEVVRHDNEVLMLIDDTVEYANATTIELSPGDRLLLYTDGAIEAVDPGGSRLYVEGLTRQVAATVAEGPGDFLQSLMTRLGRYTHDHLDDDVALLCVETL